MLHLNRLSRFLPQPSHRLAFFCLLALVVIGAAGVVNRSSVFVGQSNCIPGNPSCACDKPSDDWCKDGGGKAAQCINDVCYTFDRRDVITTNEAGIFFRIKGPFGWYGDPNPHDMKDIMYDLTVPDHERDATPCDIGAANGVFFCANGGTCVSESFPLDAYRAFLPEPSCVPYSNYAEELEYGGAPGQPRVDKLILYEDCEVLSGFDLDQCYNRIDGLERRPDGKAYSCSTLTAWWCEEAPPPPVCENGIVDPGEECDGGDHCDQTCSCDDGYTPDPTSPGACCQDPDGDGACGCPDDLMFINSDGQCECEGDPVASSTTCYCPTPGTKQDPNDPTVCIDACGEGTIDQGEECDSVPSCLGDCTCDSASGYVPVPGENKCEYEDTCPESAVGTILVSECRDMCDNQTSTEKELEQCVAQCVCDCRAQSGGAALVCYDECIEDPEHACDQDADCCRAECIDEFCPESSGDNGGDGTTSGGPPGGQTGGGGIAGNGGGTTTGGATAGDTGDDGGSGGGSSSSAAGACGTQCVASRDMCVAACCPSGQVCPIIQVNQCVAACDWAFDDCVMACIPGNIGGDGGDNDDDDDFPSPGPGPGGSSATSFATTSVSSTSVSSTSVSLSSDSSASSDDFTICCDPTGNFCNFFGTCANPYPDLASCQADCGVSTSSSSSSSTSSFSNSSSSTSSDSFSSTSTSLSTSISFSSSSILSTSVASFSSSAIAAATHFTCMNQACAEVIGAGDDTCSTDTDCVSSFSSSSFSDDDGGDDDDDNIFSSGASSTLSGDDDDGDDDNNDSSSSSSFSDDDGGDDDDDNIFSSGASSALSGDDDDDDTNTGVCGDGQMDSGEQCEVGINSCAADRACDEDSCTCFPIIAQPECGDGQMHPGEQCEVGIDSCTVGRVCDTAICTCIPPEPPDDDDGGGDDDDDGTGAVCGNGQMNPGEQCEVGINSCTSGRTCDTDSCTCYPTTAQPLCGNGQMNPGEQCEVGIDSCTSGRTCEISSCTCVPPNFSPPDDDTDDDTGENPIIIATNQCGNGRIDPREQCDDGNLLNGDGCSDRCLIEQRLVAAASICGNGILEPPEECDDSNRRDNDGCSSTCLLEVGICGDGIVQSLLGEQCEQGQSLPDTITCQRCRYVSQSCGDNIIDPGEECDDGSQNSTSPDAVCRPDCSLGRCGDGIVDSTELCDDGNRLGGDGCDRYCRTESTQIAADTTTNQNSVDISFNPLQPSQQINFPSQPTVQQLPFQLPLAQLQPLIQNQAPVGDTGPAAVAIIAAGAAAGWGYVRRRRK